MNGRWEGRRVRVVEVGPRDGLQNEPEQLPLAVKLDFTRALIAAGLKAVEVGAFVGAERVPQMADTEDLVRALTPAQGCELWALVPNLQGLQRAADCGIRHVAVFGAASEAFSEANVGASVADSLATIKSITAQARRHGMRLRGYVSTAFWCPFSGPVRPQRVRQVALELMDCGCDELSIADTVGAATPNEVERVLEDLLADLPATSLGVHFHDTRGTALANVFTALRLGVTTIDAAAGGLGGCPFAPGAQGNLATEDLIYALHGAQIDTGVDLAAVRAASLALQGHLGRPLPSRYLRAGPPTGADGDRR